MIEESKMSLGYVKGQYWVADTRYDAYTHWETYKKTIEACRMAGFMFECRYSYTSRKYEAETYALVKFPSGYHKVLGPNAFHENPMQALVYAIRKRDHGSPLLTVLCVELECFLLREKLLPFRRLEDALEGLGDQIVLALR